MRPNEHEREEIYFINRFGTNEFNLNRIVDVLFYSEFPVPLLYFHFRAVVSFIIYFDQCIYNYYFRYVVLISTDILCCLKKNVGKYNNPGLAVS